MIKTKLNINGFLGSTFELLSPNRLNSDGVVLNIRSGWFSNRYKPNSTYKGFHDFEIITRKDVRIF